MDKRNLILIGVVVVLAVGFVVFGSGGGGMQGKIALDLSAKKSVTAQLPFDVMKQRFVELGVTEEQMWKKLRSSNVILYDFKDMQLAYALRQINDPKVDVKMREASKEWVKEKINTFQPYISAGKTGQQNIAWLITVGDSLNAVALGVSSFSSDLPLDTEKLKDYLNKKGEGGFTGGSGGYGGAGGTTAPGGTPAPGGKAGGSFLACVQGQAAKSMTGNGSRPKTDIGDTKKGGGKPGVTDGSSDSTTTEGSSSEGKSTIGGDCGTVNWDAAKGGNGGISDTGNIHEYSNNAKDYSWSVTVDKGEGGKTTISFKADNVKENGIGEKTVSGTTTMTKVDGQGQKTTESNKESGMTPEQNKAGFDAVKNEANKQKKENNANGVTTGVDSKAPKEGGDPDKQSNPMEGSDPVAACGAAAANCAASSGMFGANAALKQLAQDCQNAKAQDVANEQKSSGKSKGGAQKTAPGICGQISPGCMKELTQGPATDAEGPSNSCQLSSAEALGFSKQMMVSDPADIVGFAALKGQTSSKANMSKGESAAASSASSKSTAGTDSKASTGASSAGANAQKSKAAGAGGECIGGNC